MRPKPLAVAALLLCLLTATSAFADADARILERINRAMRAAATFQVAGELYLEEDDASRANLVMARLKGARRNNGDGRLLVNVVSAPEDRSFTMETRSVGGVRYVRGPNSRKWFIRPSPDEDSPDGVLNDALLGQLALSGIISGRGGFLNGEPVLRIRGTAAGDGSPVQVTLWVADADRRIRKIRVEASVAASPFAPMLPAEMETVRQVYELHVFGLGQPVRISAPPVAVQEERIQSPFGTMAVYRGKRAPFRFEYPADWREGPPNPNVTATFLDPEDGQLVVSEERLDTPGYEADSLETYVDLVLSVARSNVEDFELVSNRRFKHGKLRARVLTFLVESGALTVRRFIYFHEGIGVNITYVVQSDRFERMEPLVNYSQQTLALISE
ncbi:MAG: hypothetical protein V3U11_02680 [Planctomycetota bacterium]